MIFKEYVLKEFYIDIISKKIFYLPVLLVLFLGYSFSLFNRSVSIDDLLLSGSLGNGSILSGRWGMYVWCQLLGLSENVPFVYRFLSIIFLVLSSFLLCYIFYTIRRVKDILPYTLCASMFLSFPLINEIWEYTVNFIVVGNLVLVTLAAIAVREEQSPLRRVLIAAILLLLPMSSYETAIFYYITLVEIILFYETAVHVEIQFGFVEWIKKNINYFIPAVIAFLSRFLISFIINIVYGLDYNGGGDTSIIWLKYDFMPTLKGMLVSNINHYLLYGLVYLPISIFVLLLIYFFYALFRINRTFVLLLGLIIVVSLFSQAILQGDLLFYRHAQTITLFVSFSVYLFCVSVNKWRKLLYVVLFAMCWYQAIYLNRILCLNNLRSDNELTVVRELGMKIVSEYDKKPIVFVGVRPSLGSWINRQVSVNEAEWNGRLFYRLSQKLGEHGNIPIKYVGTNVNTVMAEYLQLKNLFSYCGYEIEVIPDYFSGKVDTQTEKIREEAAAIAEKKGIRPYQIYDNNKYLIVNLGGDNMKQ